MSERKGKVVPCRWTENRKGCGESGAMNLEAESIRSRSESTRGCVKLKTVTEIRRSSARDVAHHHSASLPRNILLACRYRTHQAACMCFHAINGSGFSYLAELVHLYTASGTFRSISSDSRIDKIIQYKRKTRGFRSSSCFGLYIWNSLPS